MDLYCAKARLIVELDGPVHERTREEDTIRQEFLERLGLRVLRFTNAEVSASVDSVVEQVEAAARQTSPLSLAEGSP